jgi:hypothetical protein
MATESEKRQEVSQLLIELRDAWGASEKLDAAANLLAALDLIPDTPHSKFNWKLSAKLPY